MFHILHFIVFLSSSPGASTDYNEAGKQLQATALAMAIKTHLPPALAAPPNCPKDKPPSNTARAYGDFRQLHTSNFSACQAALTVTLTNPNPNPDRDPNPSPSPNPDPNPNPNPKP